MNRTIGYVATIAFATLILVIGMGLTAEGGDGLEASGTGNPPPQPQVSAPAGIISSSLPVRPGSIVLWDQYDNPGMTATSSQNFEPALDAYDSVLADDFVIPLGASWAIDLVEVDGVYYNGAGPADSVNVYIYMDRYWYGRPWLQQIHSRTNIPYTPGPNPGDLVIPLNPPVMLRPGVYWIAVQANQSLKTTGQWGWTDRTVLSSSRAAWRNTEDGFRLCGGTGYIGPLWYWRSTDCWIDPAAPDQVFRLSGMTATSTPGPSPTATPTGTPPPPPQTRTPSPTPGPRCALLPPDPYGYRCDDTQAHTYIEGATDTGLAQDDQVATAIPIGFSFNFYGTSYNAVNVSSNGTLQFATTNNAFANTALPNSALGPMIAPFWDDLYLPACRPTCGIYYSTIGSPGNRTFIVEYRAVPGIPQPSAPSIEYLTFEVQLEEATGDIWVLYQTMVPPYGNGHAATLGIQNGTVAFQYSFDQTNATRSSVAIRYFRLLPTLPPPTSTPTDTPLPTSTPTTLPSYSAYLPLILYNP